MKPTLFKLYYSPAFQAAQLDRRRIALPPALHALSGRSILFMTDLHSSRMFPPRALEQLIDQANALRPDLVLLGGDLADRTSFSVPVGGQRVEGRGRVYVDGLVRGEVYGSFSGRMRGSITGNVNLHLVSGSTEEDTDFEPLGKENGDEIEAD